MRIVMMTVPFLLCSCTTAAAPTLSFEPEPELSKGPCTFKPGVSNAFDDDRLYTGRVKCKW